MSDAQLPGDAQHAIPFSSSPSPAFRIRVSDRVQGDGMTLSTMPRTSAVTDTDVCRGGRRPTSVLSLPVSGACG